MPTTSSVAFGHEDEATDRRPYLHLGIHLRGSDSGERGPQATNFDSNHSRQMGSQSGHVNSWCRHTYQLRSPVGLGRIVRDRWLALHRCDQQQHPLQPGGGDGGVPSIGEAQARRQPISNNRDDDVPRVREFHYAAVSESWYARSASRYVSRRRRDARTIAAHAYFRSPSGDPYLGPQARPARWGRWRPA